MPRGGKKREVQNAVEQILFFFLQNTSDLRLFLIFCSVEQIMHGHKQEHISIQSHHLFQHVWGCKDLGSASISRFKARAEKQYCLFLPSPLTPCAATDTWWARMFQSALRYFAKGFFWSYHGVLGSGRVFLCEEMLMFFRQQLVNICVKTLFPTSAVKSGSNSSLVLVHFSAPLTLLHGYTSYCSYLQ